MKNKLKVSLINWMHQAWLKDHKALKTDQGQVHI